MIIRFMSLLITVILLLSCKESKQDRVTRLINEWNGKTIHFPDNM